MTKKKKTAVKKRGVNHPGDSGDIKVEKVLIENFVSLQHVMTNLALKFDNLAGQISKLLELFEISAKTLAEKGPTAEDKTNTGVMEKLDSLLEQNKVIARGIALIHEGNAEQQPSPQIQRTVQYPIQQPPRKIMEMEGYQKSSAPELSKDLRK
jgi:hypothetical protein